MPRPRDDDYDDDYADAPSADDAACDEQPDDRPQERKRNWLRDLEQRARRADEEAAARKAAEDKAEAAARELALLKAGVDVESPTGKLFAKAYDGPSDVQAVLAAAREYGVVKPEVAPEEVAAEQRIGDAGLGSVPAGSSAPDPRAELDNIPDFTQDGRAFNPNAQAEVLAWARRQGLSIINDRGQVGALQQQGAVTQPLD